ncbi:hypothetical protein KQX54_006963 [Cotesia glomerata]|uniref:Uncharacterized protein n=1 Tax=Cotesia glomerata TaxID=32391 RepID=A0AAV7I801_COTGL|nr:hypothetical protein KQX54_006963 [Cotesia glomerata]
MIMQMTDDEILWVILVGPVFGGRCGAEALGLGLGLSLGPAYRFALPPGLAAKTTRCLVQDQACKFFQLNSKWSENLIRSNVTVKIDRESVESRETLIPIQDRTSIHSFPVTGNSNEIRVGNIL